MSASSSSADAGGSLNRMVRPFFRSFEPVHLVWLIVTVAVVGMIAVPSAYLVYEAFASDRGFTLDAFLSTVGNPRTIAALINTLIYSTGTTIISIVIAVPLAILTERTNTSKLTKQVVRVTVIASVITPGFLAAMSYVNLLGPNAGMINLLIRELLGLDINRGPLNIFSIVGVLLLGSHGGIAYIYLICAASLSKMNPEFEESAAISGSGKLRIVRTITLPLVRNAVFSGALVSMLTSLADYGTPHMVGYTVLTLRIRELMIYSQFDAAASASILLIGLSLLVLALYRFSIRKGDFSTVTGKSFQPGTFDIGRWLPLATVLLWTYALLAVVLPIAGLAITSLLDRLGDGPRWGNYTLDHYRTMLAWDSIAVQAFWNSIRLAIGAAVITSLMAIVIGYITVRRKSVQSTVLDYISIVPLGLAGTALGVAIISMVLNPPVRSLGLYGTLWVLLFAYVIRNFPLALRPVQTTLAQVSPELEHAARMSGAGWFRTVRTILLPLIMPGVSVGFVLVFLHALTEISASIVLRNIGTQTVSTAIIDIWDGRGGYQGASAVAIVLFVLMISVVALAQALGGRRIYSAN